MSELPQYITVVEASKLTNIPAFTLRRLCREGKLRALKADRHVKQTHYRIELAALKIWLDSLTSGVAR